MNLLASIERSLRSRSGGKKKRKAKRKTKRRASKRKAKIVFRTRTKTVVRHVHHRPKARHGAVRRMTSKKRRAKKSGKRKLKFGSPAWRKKYMKR